MVKQAQIIRRRAERGQTVREIAADMGLRPEWVRRVLARRAVMGRPASPRVTIEISREKAAKLGLLRKST